MGSRWPQDYLPDPPEEKGWYCVNFFADWSATEPGHLVCKPEPVWWDPADDEIVAYDPKGQSAGGHQGVEMVAIWGERIHGKPPPDFEQRAQEAGS